MENGKVPIVYNLDDLQTIYNKESHGVKGMWGFHNKCHNGHIECAEITKKNSDWMLGIYWNNYGKGIETINGTTEEVDKPILQSDINELKKRSNVIMIFTGNYHPYMKYYDYLKSEFDKAFPYNFLKNNKLMITSQYGSLIYSVFIRIMMHEIYNIKINYNTNSKDRWKIVGYNQWCEKRFGIKMKLIDSIKNELGNVMASSFLTLPENLKKRVNKRLLQPYFKTIEDVKNNIKDIKNLEANDFFIKDGWVQCKFNFKNHKKWIEGHKCP